MNKEILEITNEDIELLKEMRKNCLKSNVYEDDKRLLKSNAITKFLMLYEENTQLKQQLKDKDEKISKAIEYCNGSAFEVSTREYGMLNVINYEDVLEILESNKEE